jgi:transposase-like protein
LVKAGRNASGTQRFQCKACKRYTTVERKANGYGLEMRQQAIRLHLDGNGVRQISRLLQVNHQTVANWISTCTASLE